MADFLDVLDAGLLSTVQDLGRPGLAHLGVPRSGALDQPALRQANRLVGNGPEAAGLEVTLSGCRLRWGGSGRFAVAGAPCAVRIDGREVPWGTALSVPAGAEVELGAPFTGVRSYLAVAGGVLVEPVLGSRSTDVLSGLGPPPLQPGDRLPIGTPLTAPGPAAAAAVPGPSGTVLRLLPGPRENWFAPESLAALDGAVYEVSPESNRIGLRLRGTPLMRAGGMELPSEGMVLGAVQVPPSGQPVVFLNDHPTTGGYPVVAVVHPDDLPVCAQARPGERLTLRLAPPPRGA